MKNQNSHPRKFCILTTQRSGSTWLSTLLDSNPQIQGFRELFIDQEFVFPDTELSTFPLYQRNNSGSRPGITFEYLSKLDDYLGDQEAIGFKLMYDQLLDYPELILKFITEKYKFIHLVRENHLDVVISGKIKDDLGAAHFKVKIEPKKVYLEPSWLIKNLKKRDLKRKLAHVFLAIMPNEVLNITYDDLRTDRDKTLTQISEFLSLNNENQGVFNSELKKINRKSHQEMIQNYEEVQSVLSGTKFVNYLNP